MFESPSFRHPGRRRAWVWFFLLALASLLWAQGQGRSHTIELTQTLKPGEVLVCTSSGMVRMRFDVEPISGSSSADFQHSEHCAVCAVAGALPLTQPVRAPITPSPQPTGIQHSRAGVFVLPQQLPLQAHAPPQGPPQIS